MSRIDLGQEQQADLLSAAVRLYEAEMYELCMILLQVLMQLGNKESYVLAGHCISSQNYSDGETISNMYYKISCDLGSGVGCYNLYLNHKKTNIDEAAKYLKRAKKLGWIE